MCLFQPGPLACGLRKVWVSDVLSSLVRIDAKRTRPRKSNSLARDISSQSLFGPFTGKVRVPSILRKSACRLKVLSYHVNYEHTPSFSNVPGTCLSSSGDFPNFIQA